MNNTEPRKGKCKKELLEMLEYKKKHLQLHCEEITKKTVVITVGVLVLSKLLGHFIAPKNNNKRSTFSLSNSLLYPIFLPLIQNGVRVLVDRTSRWMINSLEREKPEI